jgi:TetR/AcrR family transcriptional repressor of mexJK operon
VKPAMTGTDRRQARRAQIRNAARELFLREGFEGASTDAIVAAAGIASKETLYRHYRSKEELFVDVIRSMTVEGPLLGDLLEREPAPATLDELRSLLRLLVARMLKAMLQPEYLALMRIVAAALPRFPELGALYREAVPLRALGYIEELLRRGQAAGILRSDRDSRLLSRMVLGVPLTYAILDGLLEGGRRPPAPRPEVSEGLVDHLLEIAAKRGVDSAVKPRPKKAGRAERPRPAARRQTP